MKWSIYNQSLVRRSEFLLGFDVTNNGDTDIKEVNKDKVSKLLHTRYNSVYLAINNFIFIITSMENYRKLILLVKQSI